MTVFAASQQDAYNHVALNGWTVIDVERLNEKEAEQFILSIDSLSNDTPEKVEIESVMSDGNIGDPELKSDKDGTEDITGYPPIKKLEEPPNLLPSSPQLEFIALYNFELGVVKPIRNPVNNGKISALDKEGRYVVFGHADKVPVGSKSSYYGSNFELSYKRAEYIKNLMVRAGIPADNIRIVGLGSNYPTVRNNAKENPANRRVEIYGFKK